MDSRKRRVGLLVAAVTTGAMLAFAGGGTVGAQLPDEEDGDPFADRELCELSDGTWTGEECIFPDPDGPDPTVPDTTVPDPVDESDPVDEPETTTTTAPPAEVLPATQEQDPADVAAPPAAAAATAAAAPISLTG